MGIDTPAFSSGVERPRDTAAQRDRNISKFNRQVLNSGDFNLTTIHTNTSGSDQFLLTVNAAQEPFTNQPRQQDVFYQFEIQDGVQDVRFRISDTGVSLVETLPPLRVPPGFDVLAVVRNGGSGSIKLRQAVTLRQG
jgi:hypothetical protein